MGSSGSTDTQSSQQNISQTQLPPWVNQAAQQNYALAQNIANRPLTQYSGQQVADIGPQTQQAWNLAATSGGAGADQYNAAQAAYLTAAGTPATQVTPGSVTPQTLAGTNLQPYMNPYTQSVINSTLPIMQQNLALSQNQNQDQAAAANAYGGSRQAIQQGVTQAQGAQNMAQMAAQLNQANYGQAVQGAQYDIGQNMAGQQFNAGQSLNAQEANQQANQANINSMINAGTGLAGLGTAAQTNQRQQFLELSTAGAQQQQQAQNQINAQMNQFAQAQAYPGQQLGILQSALGMTPYGSTTMGSSTGQQQTTTTPSLMSDVTGGLQSLGGMFGAGGPFAGLMAGSDKHLKTDITKIGVHPPTGLPLFSYRYKGDPKSYPKVSGPMAEDAMQVAPHAVKTIGVHGPTGQAIHGVDMAALNAAGPPGMSPGMGAPAGPPPLGVPAMRPQRLPTPGAGAGAGFTPQAPGALAARAPMGLTGALGATMRPQRMRPPARMARVAGGMRG